MEAGTDPSSLCVMGKTSVSEPDPKSIEITGKICIELRGFDSLSEMEKNSDKEQ